MRADLWQRFVITANTLILFYFISLMMFPEHVMIDSDSLIITRNSFISISPVLKYIFILFWIFFHTSFVLRVSRCHAAVVDAGSVRGPTCENTSFIHLLCSALGHTGVQCGGGAPHVYRWSVLVPLVSRLLKCSSTCFLETSLSFFTPSKCDQAAVLGLPRY